LGVFWVFFLKPLNNTTMVPPSYIKKIECGSRQMSIEVMVKILDCLDTSADYLIGGNDSYAMTLAYLKRISDLLDELIQKI
jgi:transcriptional regulator with XRE-family HTH domain